MARDLSTPPLTLPASIRLGNRENRTPAFFGFDYTPEAGSALFGLWTSLHNGKDHNLFGVAGIEEIQSALQKDQSPFKTNIFFQKTAAPLFPLANRLRGRILKNDVIEAVVMGRTVQMPMNHQPSQAYARCHLHGLLYDKTPVELSQDLQETLTQVTSVFPSGFYGSFWTGQMELRTEHVLKNGSYEFHMTAVNTGTTPVPVGAGSHPYLVAPSMNPKALALHIPGRLIVETDGPTTVFPTGRLVETRAAGLDFSAPEGRPLEDLSLDHMWTDFDGPIHADFVDMEAEVRFRISALTPNLLGFQAYRPAGAPWVALEPVTHLPDPREELWKDTPTGMVLLPPAGEFRYGYKIEAFKLK